MPYQMKPLACDPARIRGMSERLIVSHYENNYGGAGERLELIGEQLGRPDFPPPPGVPIHGLKRGELNATNPLIPHELFFQGLGVERAARAEP